MVLDRRKLVFAFLSSAVLAAISPKVYYTIADSLQPYFNQFKDTFNSISNFQVAGYFLPWRYMLLCLLLGMIVTYIKQKRRRKANAKEVQHEADPVLISGKTLLEIHNASRNVEELTKRLESAEKTNRLIMKQMEAMTKCLAQVLQNGKSSENNNAYKHIASKETHI